MCGLVGMAGNLNSSHNKMFRDMLVFDTVRGWDSTGIAFVGMATNAEIQVEKGIGSPANLWEWGNTTLLNSRGISKGINKVMIGHNRAATIGSVNSDNAHPFTFGKITGTHNGSLTDWYDLEGYRELDVDSMAVFNTINEKGVDHTWKSFTGAAALSYWDQEEGTLNLIRNNQRPLWIAWSKRGDAVFWASELWMIETAAKRSNVDLCTDKGKTPIQLRDSVLHTFRPTSTSCPLVEVRELEKKKSAITTIHPSTIQRPYGTYRTGKSSGVYKPSSRNRGTGVNAYWGQGLNKADKTIRGKIVELISHYEFVESFGKKKCVVVFEFPNGDLLEAYPNTEEEYNTWVSRIKSDTRLYYTVRFRPRILIDSSGKFVCFRINDKGLKLHSSVTDKVVNKPNPNKASDSAQVLLPGLGADKVDDGPIINLYKGWDGLVTEDSWKRAGERMSPKHSCTLCGNPLELKDHKDIEWVGPTTACCPDCSKNDELLTQLMYMDLR